MQHAGVTSDAQTAVDKDTEVKLQGIRDSYASNKDSVVKKLMDRVILVEPGTYTLALLSGCLC